MVAYGHVGDGNLHFNVSEPAGGDRGAFVAREPEIQAAVQALVSRFRGSISAEHGIGRLKRDALARHKSPVALETMRAIKRAIDPKGIMNPGKILLDVYPSTPAGGAQRMSENQARVSFVPTHVAVMCADMPDCRRARRRHRITCGMSRRSSIGWRWRDRRSHPTGSG